MMLLWFKKKIFQSVTAFSIFITLLLCAKCLQALPLKDLLYYIICLQSISFLLEDSV